MIPENEPDGKTAPLHQEREIRSGSSTVRNQLSPFIGRIRQSAELEQAILRLRYGEGGLFIILGEAGIGKSRLLLESHSHMPANVSLLEGRSLAFSQHISYWPFIEMLRPWFGFSDSMSDRERWDTFEQAGVALLGTDADEILPYVATLMGMEVPDPYSERIRLLDGEELAAQIRRAARRFFEHLARSNPVVLIIEDLHWADRTSVGLLEHLLPLGATTQILFIVLSRPETEVVAHLQETAASVLGGRVYEFLLSSLSVRDSQALIANLIGNDPSTYQIRDLILYKAGGNPFFIEEVARVLMEGHILSYDETSGSWSILNPTKDIIIPDTVQGVIRARLDLLDMRLKEVLGIASVIGRSFFYRVLRAVTEPEAELDTRLANLTAAQLIEELKSAPELAYLFRHALAQETIYDSLDENRRLQLHERVAASIETLYAGRLHEMASLLAFHYSRAENWERALHFLLVAADQSSRMAADVEALAHYTEAVETYGRVFGEKWDPLQRAKIELRLGEIYYRRGDHAEAFDHLRRSVELAGESVPHRGRALHVRQRIELGRFAIHALFPDFLQPRMQENATPSSEILVRAFEVMGWASYLAYPEYLDWIIARWVNQCREGGFARGYALGLSAIAGQLDEAGLKRVSRRLLRKAQGIADRFSMKGALFVRFSMGKYQYLNGEWGEAEKIFVEVAQLADRTGDLINWTIANTRLGQLWNETGEFHSARELADKMIKLGREAAFQSALRFGLLMRGRSLWHLGQLAESEAALNEGLSISRTFGDKFNIALIGSELVRCLVRQEDIGPARLVLNELTSLARSTKLALVARYSIAVANCELTLYCAERSERETVVSVADAVSACADLYRMGRRHRAYFPSVARLQGRAEWLRGRKRVAMHHWRAGTREAAHLRAKFELGLIHYDMNTRTGNSSEAEQWRVMLESLGRN